MKKFRSICHVLLIIIKVICFLIKLAIFMIRGVCMKHVSARYFKKQLRTLGMPKNEAKILTHCYKRIVSMNDLT